MLKVFALIVQRFGQLMNLIPTHNLAIMWVMIIPAPHKQIYNSKNLPI